MKAPDPPEDTETCVITQDIRDIGCLKAPDPPEDTETILASLTAVSSACRLKAPDPPEDTETLQVAIHVWFSLRV